MFYEIYRGRKVFVTGHTGFKGSWLCAWLISLGAEVFGYSKGLPGKPDNFTAIDLGSRMADYRGDIRSRADLGQALDACRPEIIFHLAAQALVRPSYDDPVYTFETNMLGVMNILEEARKRPFIKTVVIITSDKCYRNEEWIWGYRETDRLGGDDPYSASKGCAELIAHSYFASFFKTGAACATARAGNVIGGGDWAKDRIVPDCARAWAAGKPVDIRNPSATRPWQHVLEPLSGYLWLGANLFFKNSAIPPKGESYNFGPPSDVINTVAEVAGDLKRYWPGFEVRLGDADCVNKKECGLLKLCCDKALAELFWRPTLRFEETIRYTAEWYARYYAEDPVPDMWSYTQGQIAAYVNAATERGLAWTRI